VELFSDFPQSSQSHSAQLDLLLLFELGEQSFDLAARSLRMLALGRSC
jgi:hypothetical protein